MNKILNYRISKNQPNIKENKVIKKLTLIITICLISSLMIAGVAIAAPGTKVDVCHFDKDTGTYILININDNAWDAHIAHGDAAPGEPVPGMTGYKFDAQCTPIPIIDVTGHWTGHSGLVNNMVYTFYMDLVQASDFSVTGTIVYTNYSATRTVTGYLTGNTLTLITSQTGFSATLVGPVTGTTFHGYGTQTGGANVELEAWR